MRACLWFLCLISRVLTNVMCLCSWTNSRVRLHCPGIVLSQCFPLFSLSFNTGKKVNTAQTQPITVSRDQRCRLDSKIFVNSLTMSWLSKINFVKPDQRLGGKCPDFNSAPLHVNRFILCQSLNVNHLQLNLQQLLTVQDHCFPFLVHVHQNQ